MTSFEDINDWTCHNHSIPSALVCDICNEDFHQSRKLVCSMCVYNLLQKFSEKEKFCKDNGDPIMLIAQKLNEHTEAINKLHEQMKELLNESK